MENVIELEKWLYADVPEKEGFQVTDLQSADWTVRKAKEAETRIIQRETLAAAYKQRIDEWLAEANKADKDTVDYMAALLKPFVEAELKGQKTRTLKLPSGDAQIRKMPDRIEIGDEVELVAFLEAAAPDAVRIRKEVDKTALKKLVLEDGNLYKDGRVLARIAGGEERLYIK